MTVEPDRNPRGHGRRPTRREGRALVITMIDLTRSLYLGLRHPRSTLDDWDGLTSGVPAALGEPGPALAVARDLAGLLGVERASLGTSTLHLFWDLFGAT